ncbi:MAG: FecR family protein [Prevotella sp.]|jgi:ferric-dicitrate binding protein FerR (iron transport regulator)|nr:FecR family protein [Prevotella sp.]
MEDEVLFRYIKGEASSQEKKSVILWIHETEENKQKFREYRRLYDILAWQKKGTSVSIKRLHLKPAHLFTNILKIAAVFIFGFGLSYFFRNTKGSEQEVLYQTLNVPTGQRAELILADGTNVWLNANSSITFPTKFDAENRIVTLKGEAYFDVQKKPEQPFLVRSGDYTIRVLGTQFNVQAYPQNPAFEADLIEGSVEILKAGDNNKPITLNPGSKVRIEGGKYAVSSITDYDYYLWKEGLICFDDIILNDLFKQLELYFDIKINIKDRSLLIHKYTGKFRTKEGIEHILKTLQLSNDFKYHKNEKENSIEIY